MKKHLLLFGFLLLFACNNESDPVSEEKLDNQELTTPLEIAPVQEVSLLPQAKKEVEQWPAYQNTESAINNLKDYNLEELMANSKQLIGFIDELRNTLPSNYRVPPITSRINVLHTKTQVLQQELTSETVDRKEIKTIAGEIASSFEYLKIQFNELFLQSPSNFEIDLFEIEAKQDSLELIKVDSTKIAPTAPVVSPLKRKLE
ncbi:MAG TPA: hypothetical protein VFM70_07840 [Salinimicrobium sp.]|nr:hypothetical protein [Salinimicrobium sp.]